MAHRLKRLEARTSSEMHRSGALQREPASRRTSSLLHALELPTCCENAALGRDPLEALLRRAIVRDELMLHFQPLVDARSRRIVQAEASLRWDSPDLGALSTHSLIPLAEQYELILPLTLWVLNEALSQCHGWQADEMQLGVSVNLSPACLEDPRFAQRIGVMLRSWELAPSRLTLELWPGDFPPDMTGALRTLQQLRDMGVAIALDHFGRGASSLERLRQLRVDRVKLDRSYIVEFTSHPQDRVIVEGLVAMAHQLGSLAVATDIPDAETADALAAAGFDLLQGEALGEPLPAESFSQRWLSPQNG